MRKILTLLIATLLISLSAPAQTQPENKLTISVNHGECHIVKIPRSKLINLPTFKTENILPEVYLELPCTIPCGFKVKYDIKSVYIAQFNEITNDIVLCNLERENYIDGTVDYYTGETSHAVYFPLCETKVRFPIEFVTKNIDPNDFDRIHACGISFRNSKSQPCIVWDDDTPDYIKDSLSFPKPSNENYSGYTIFIGYKVVNDMDGINEVVDSETVNPTVTYDLQGRPVTNPAHGLYIRNGQKTIL